MKVGYACINNTLAEKKIQVNRSMMKRTFLSKGVHYASELALKNVTDLEEVINWNVRYKILLYRLSSDMFPWMSEYNIADLPDYADIKKILMQIGKKAAASRMRLTYHPGQFNVLASANPAVVEKTVKELSQHGEIMDLLGLPASPFAKINIHVGGAYGDKVVAMERFAENFQRLPQNVQRRLTVENDDKANMFSINDLMYLHERINIPVVFDYLHHKFCTGGLTEKEALSLAISTWPKDIVPIVHFSSSRKVYEDAESLEAAHADYIYEDIPLYGYDIDVMLEAKAKELAVKEYLRQRVHAG